VEVRTNEYGEYRTPSFRLGEYEISIEAPGFKRFDQRGVVLNIGDVRQMDATLEIGQVSQTITVEVPRLCCKGHCASAIKTIEPG
jgi:hypothetical protein